MKIQCDVCGKGEATVFCVADEAALCDTCEHRVHHANKLASKHQRFSLLHPSSKEYPLCDICQEKRAFLFCQQDRAILCRDCDLPIHNANGHTQKHNRFLLSGIKFSATPAFFTSSTTSETNGCDYVPDPKSQRSSVPNPPSRAKTSNSITSTTAATTTTKKGGDSLVVSENNGSTSSISEYLEMLPGWHVEDFLDSSYTPFGFWKGDNGMLPSMDGDLESNIGSFTSENLGFWVPQTPAPLCSYPSQMGGQIVFKETKETTSMKSNRKWTDVGFIVPQITPPSAGFKRSRPLW
ncbi:Salt tolerance 2 putative isoform 1 [Tripterygium wilfordii]|uniref:Salt tolerance 2 putative isoform 1 n=1 Tax=Tripterygium wilfordii TaxID=458696 RepID=A0A7J7CZ47_TRIWF|nr:B-box zinc finger protein 21-like [Tripterygium wilfordii]KAF5739363.1 Salt tolerance 2 putative isoform 1 [Tripterygium wilfordii]